MALFAYESARQFYEFVESHYGTAYDEVEATATLAHVAMLKSYIFKTYVTCYRLGHLDFLAYAVDEVEFTVGPHDGERYAWKASAATQVDERSAVDRSEKLRYGERVEYVVDIQVVDILA